MTAEEFVKCFLAEKNSLVDSAFDSKNKTLVATLIGKMQLNDNQTEQLKEIINSVLTDAFYTILLGLDGEASIGKQQVSYHIFDEENNELTGSGEIEEFAYMYFQEEE